MFLHHLDETQQRAFFALAKRMIMADGDLDKNELGYLNDLAKQSDVSGKDPFSAQNDPVDLDLFPDRVSQTAVALELMMLAYSDEELHIAESQLFGALMERFDFSDDDCERLADAAGWGAAVVNEFKVLVDETE